MKITIEHCNEKVSIETDQDNVSLYEFMDYVRRIATVMYNEKLINDYWA